MKNLKEIRKAWQLVEDLDIITKGFVSQSPLSEQELLSFPISFDFAVEPCSSIFVQDTKKE